MAVAVDTLVGNMLQARSYRGLVDREDYQQEAVIVVMENIGKFRRSTSSNLFGFITSMAQTAIRNRSTNIKRKDTPYIRHLKVLNAEPMILEGKWLEVEDQSGIKPKWEVTDPTGRAFPVHDLKAWCSKMFSGRAGAAYGRLAKSRPYEGFKVERQP